MNTLRIDIVTIFPQMVELIAAYGVTGRAVKNGLLSVNTWNPREYAEDAYRSVDDKPYGGGPGMVMCAQPLRRCLRAVRDGMEERTKIIYLSPQGRRLDQGALCEMAASRGLVMVAGRYEGIDERLIELEIDEEWSIGDYVLSGGELAAMVVIDGLARLLPGALGHGESAQQDSFMEGLLDYPHYTRPFEVGGREVPRVLVSGNHAQIQRWRHKQALGRTALRRPDLLERREISENERILLEEYMRECNKMNGFEG
jgi:tRNA (guanine37-N1)-methyltransferase